MPSMVSYPRRLQSGHITCYLIRTYHVLTTLRTHRIASDPRIDVEGPPFRRLDAEGGVAQPCELNSLKIHKILLRQPATSHSSDAGERAQRAHNSRKNGVLIKTIPVAPTLVYKMVLKCLTSKCCCHARPLPSGSPKWEKR